MTDTANEQRLLEALIDALLEMQKLRRKQDELIDKLHRVVLDVTQLPPGAARMVGHLRITHAQLPKGKAR